VLVSTGSLALLICSNSDFLTVLSLGCIDLKGLTLWGLFYGVEPLNCFVKEPGSTYGSPSALLTNLVKVSVDLRHGLLTIGLIFPTSSLSFPILKFKL
jgi:hypothetical protein